MSETRITIEEVVSVQDHTNADRLSVIQVLGYQVVTGRDQFKVGDLVVYFPPDILIPDGIARELGVEKYLKHALYPGDIGRSQCRVSAARLRGVPSYGFVSPLKVPCDVSLTPGNDVTDYFGGVKYEPPVREGAGDAEREFSSFHKYTSIENIQRYPDLIEDGTPVVITEKIHGTNCRMGLCRDNSGELIYMAGSHKIPRKEGGLYWSFMDSVRQMLADVSQESGGYDVIIFGEIFGPGVQDLTYGQVGKSFRAFDISVCGIYFGYTAFKAVCQKYGIPMVPELYVGPFSKEVVEKYTHGDTTFSTGDKFRGREGIVIKTIMEEVDHLGRRVILKSISADYLDRKGAQDLE